MADLTYGRVTGRFLAFVGDGPTDTDETPDAVPLTGSVIFTPSISAALLRVLDPEAAIAVARPITATLDDEGYLSRNDVRGVYLIATDTPGLSPSDFTYQASFAQLRQGGGTVALPAFSFRLPGGSAIDLANTAPSPTSPGTVVIVSAADAVRAERAAERAEAAADRADAGSGAGGYRLDYSQNTAAAEWSIPHAAGRVPAHVTVRDVDGNTIIADVRVTSTLVLITHAAPLAGSVTIT